MPPARINHYRAYVTWAIRAVALGLIVYGGFWCTNRILFGLLCGQSFFATTFQTWMGIGEGSATYLGLTSLLIGIPLGAFSKRLSHWVITIPSDACPGCGYLRPITDHAPTNESATEFSIRCPECGLSGFMPNPPSSQNATHDAGTSI